MVNDMNIEIKILNKKFYGRSNEQMLSFPPKDIYDLPYYATSGSAAMDLVCTQDVVLYPGETKAIHTGLAVWIGSDKSGIEDKHSECYIKTDVSVAGLILPRSGLGTKGLILANTIGCIDEDYQGELIVQAWNKNKDERSFRRVSFRGESRTEYLTHEGEIELKAGDRFAQLMFVPTIKAQWNIVEDFSRDTQRGQGGFGSTGE